MSTTGKLFVSCDYLLLILLNPKYFYLSVCISFLYVYTSFYCCLFHIIDPCISGFSSSALSKGSNFIYFSGYCFLWHPIYVFQLIQLFCLHSFVNTSFTFRRSWYVIFLILSLPVFPSILLKNLISLAFMRFLSFFVVTQL